MDDQGGWFGSVTSNLSWVSVDKDYGLHQLYVKSGLVIWTYVNKIELCLFGGQIPNTKHAISKCAFSVITVGMFISTLQK